MKTKLRVFQVAIILFIMGLYAMAQHAHPSSDPPASNKAEAHNHHHDDNTHEEEYGTALSYAELKSTVDQVERARQATAKYHDVKAAQADGYRNFTGDSIPGMGIHYIKATEPDAFELDKPPMLLYEADPSGPGGYSLVGVAYLLKSAEGPDGQPVNNPFARSLAVWHKHAHICMFKDNRHSDKLSEEECQQQGGHFLAESQWMIHAWIWKESPLGVFSSVNPRVAGSPAREAGVAK